MKEQHRNKMVNMNVKSELNVRNYGRNSCHSWDCRCVARELRVIFFTTNEEGGSNEKDEDVQEKVTLAETHTKENLGDISQY